MVLLLLLGALLILPVAGALYESRAKARDARMFPPAGVLVDVGGRRLHLLCVGTGAPTVIFEASGFSNAISSQAVRSEVARHTRVCSYDRMGVGWSDPGPSEISAGMLADDLRRLQDNAALDGPFIIVTGSIGGMVTEMYARRYPERVAGLVFLDAANSEMIPRAMSMIGLTRVRLTCAAITAAGRIGTLRLLDPFRLRVSSSEDAARSASLMYRAQPWNALCALMRGMKVTQAEFDRAPPLRSDVRLTVLTAERSRGFAPAGLAGLDEWVRPLRMLLLDTHPRLAQRSTRGVWRVVPGSDHLIASSQPQVVAEAVLEMLTAIRGAN